MSWSSTTVGLGVVTAMLVAINTQGWCWWSALSMVAAAFDVGLSLGDTEAKVSVAVIERGWGSEVIIIAVDDARGWWPLSMTPAAEMVVAIVGR